MKKLIIKEYQEEQVGFCSKPKGWLLEIEGEDREAKKYIKTLVKQINKDENNTKKQ